VTRKQRVTVVLVLAGVVTVGAVLAAMSALISWPSAVVYVIAIGLPASLGLVNDQRRESIIARLGNPVARGIRVDRALAGLLLLVYGVWKGFTPITSIGFGATRMV
jgi:hypothetical protein